MGLSQRKDKQRIGTDPRNLTWSNDTSRFSYKHLTNLGWSSSSGIGGSSLEGNPNHIAVVRKFDSGGIGMDRARKEGDDQAAGAGPAGRDFESVLKRLAAESASAPGTSTPNEEVATPTGEEVERKRAKIASRQRHLQSKRLASSSPAALAEILGVPLSSLPASPAPLPSASASLSPAPAPGATGSEPQRTAEETVTTSTLSVTDYFKQKMWEKMRARQIANGEVPDEPKPKPTELNGTDEWKGSRTTFDEVPESEVDEKAGKKAKKEARRLNKLAQLGEGDALPEVKLETVDEPETKVKKKRKGTEEGGDVATSDDKVAKKARKEAKKAKSDR